MTTPFNARHALTRAARADRQVVSDPGSGGVIGQNSPLFDLSVVELTGAGARTLDSAAFYPLGMSVLCISQTDAISVNSVTIDDGEHVEFIIRKDSSGDHEWAARSSTAALTAALTAAESDIDDLEAKINQTFTKQLPLYEFRIFDAPNTALTAGPGGTSSANDLGLTVGTIGSSNATLNCTLDDVNANQSARYPLQVPLNYVAGEDLTVRVTVTETAAADTAATVDLFVFRSAAPSVDLVATAAQDILGASSSVFSFTLTGTDVVPGEFLELMVRINVNDTGGATDPADYEIEAIDYQFTVS